MSFTTAPCIRSVYCHRFPMQRLPLLAIPETRNLVKLGTSTPIYSAMMPITANMFEQGKTWQYPRPA
jgi:hypothetical protein